MHSKQNTSHIRYHFIIINGDPCTVGGLIYRGDTSLLGSNPPTTTTHFCYEILATELYTCTSYLWRAEAQKLSYKDKTLAGFNAQDSKNGEQNIIKFYDRHFLTPWWKYFK